MYFLSYLNHGTIYAISVCFLTDWFVQKADKFWVFGRRNASQNDFWIFTGQPINT